MLKFQYNGVKKSDESIFDTAVLSIETYKTFIISNKTLIINDNTYDTDGINIRGLLGILNEEGIVYSVLANNLLDLPVSCLCNYSNFRYMRILNSPCDLTGKMYSPCDILFTYETIDTGKIISGKIYSGNGGIVIKRVSQFNIYKISNNNTGY